MPAPQPNYSQYIFFNPPVTVNEDGVNKTRPGFYFSNINGVYRPLTGVENSGIDLSQIHIAQFGGDPNSRQAVTTGGAQSFNQLQANIYAMDPNYRAQVDAYNTATNPSVTGPGPQQGGATFGAPLNSQQSTAPSQAPQQSQQLPFRPGLNQQQQNGIMALLRRIANGTVVGGKPSPTDIQNLTYALGPNWQKFVPQAGQGGQSQGAGVQPTAGDQSGTSSGTPQGGAGVTGSQGTSSQILSVDQYRKTLQGTGIDVSQLNDQQVQALGMMNQVVQANAKNDKNIAPASLSPQDMKNYLNQATSQIDPYFQDQFKMAAQDALQQIGQLTGENTQNEQQMAQQFQQQKEDLINQLAEAGLAQSGIRKKAEGQLQTQQQGLVQSNRRQLQQQVYNVGSQLERLYGTQAAGLYPTVQSQALAGLPGQSIGYTPIGVQYPTAQQTEQGQIIQRQTELAQQGQAKKNFLQSGQYTPL